MLVEGARSRVAELDGRPDLFLRLNQGKPGHEFRPNFLWARRWGCRIDGDDSSFGGFLGRSGGRPVAHLFELREVRKSPEQGLRIHAEIHKTAELVGANFAKSPDDTRAALRRTNESFALDVVLESTV